MNLSLRDRWLLAALTVFWGLNWPVMKFAVQQFPPLAFRFLCLALGLLIVGVALVARGESLRVPRQHVAAVIGLSIPNMVIWHVCAIVAVSGLSSGRAAILGYTMPVWVALISVAFFGDRPTPRLWVGLVAAVIGTALLLASEFDKLAGQPGYAALMLVAACAWGYGTILMRRIKPDVSVAVLLFWMMAITASVLLVLTYLLERDAWRMPNLGEWGAIIYNAAIVFGFCHLVWFYLAQNLPPLASSLSVMMIPVLGVLSGAWLLGEQPHWQDWGALVLELVALGSVLLPTAARARKPV